MNDMIHVQVMHDSSEIIFYNTSELPVKIIRPKLSDYPNQRVICHWHEDIELIYILKGQMNYEINGNTVRLRDHCVLFVNSRQLHYGFSADKEECHFICVLFHPSLLRVNPKIFQTMAEPIISNEEIEFLLFGERDGEDYRSLSCLMRELADLGECAAPGFEWEVAGNLCKIWSVIFRHCEALPGKLVNGAHADRQLQRDMVSYIFSHYTEPLTLQDIAASGNVSRSKCCLIFNKFLRESPIDFVNSYRLEKSCQQLRNTAKSITEIALSCGFNHSSYFTKLFTRKYGCTPSQYREWQ